MGSMITPRLHTIRLIVQRVQSGSSDATYRLVAYPDPNGTTLHPVTFSSKDQLLQRLRTAFPDFDPHLLRENHDSSIVFAHEMELTSAQLSILGLR